MTCNHCGADAADYAYCRTCGTPTSEALERTTVRSAGHGTAGPQPVARRRPHSSRRLLVGTLVAALLVAAGAGFAVVRLLRAPQDQGVHTVPSGLQGHANTTDASAGSGPQQLSFATQPSASWKVEPKDFLGGKGTAFTAAVHMGYSEFTSAEALYTPREVVVGVIGGSSAETVGLDAMTGQQRWAVEAQTRCSSLRSGDLVACATNSDVFFVDAATNQVTKVDMPNIDAVASGPDGAIYTGQLISSPVGDAVRVRRIVVTRGTIANPQADWSRSYPVPERLVTDDDSPEFHIVPAPPGIVIKLRSLGLRLAGATGAVQDRVFEKDTEALFTNDGRHVVHEPDSDATGIDSLGTAPAVSGEGGPWNGLNPELASSSSDLLDTVPHRVGIGTDWFDTRSGRKLWTAQDGVRPFQAMPRAGVALARSHYDPTSWFDSAVDLLTGRALWSGRSFSTQQVEDAPRALLVVDYGPSDAQGNERQVVRAIDARTGRVAWASPPLVPDRSGTDTRTSVGATQSAAVYASTDAVVGWSGFASASAVDGLPGTRYRTPCGREPEVTPTRAVSADGSVQINLVFHAVCPGGQSVDGRSVHLAFRTQDGQVLGDGVYDFSSAPLWLPDNGSMTTTVDLPPGTVWALPDEINRDIEAKVVVVPCEHSAGSNGRDRDTGTGQTAGHVPYAPSSSTKAVRERSSLDALRRLSAADRPMAQEEMDGSWVPQLSSKALGTPDAVDQHTYDYSDIYQEHLRLRLHYPKVRLLFSSDWKSFNVPGYWVTVAGLTSTGPESPLSWCDQQGFPLSHCFAKRVLEGGPSAGSVRLRPGTPTG